MIEENPKAIEPGETKAIHPWNQDSAFRGVFNILMATGAIFLSLVYLRAVINSHHYLMSAEHVSVTKPAVVNPPLVEIPVEEPALVSIPVEKIPWWAWLYVCILIFGLGLLTALLLYLVGTWLEDQERRCQRRKPKKWWRKLLCVLASILKWITWIMAILTIIGAVIFLIGCVFITVL